MKCGYMELSYLEHSLSVGVFLYYGLSR